MTKVCLDTSFLISFADPSRPHHDIALGYYRYCLSNDIPMYISVVSAGEFEVKQSFTDLPLDTFRILPFNLPDALGAAHLFRVLHTEGSRDPCDARKIIINDLKIIAQAEEEGIGIILSEDENTMSRAASTLRTLSAAEAEVLLLKDGFTPGRLVTPDQTELPLISDLE